ncbi:MAG: type IV pilus assembly protein PilM [Candidatus Zhuqueibacterota bacterium]
MSIFKNKLNIGVDIGSSSIKIVGIKQTMKSPVLEFFRAIDLYDEGHIRHPDELNNTIISDILLELKYELDIKKEKINVSLSGPSTYLYNLEIPDVSHSEIMRAIQWQLKAIVPWELEKVELDYYPIPLKNSAQRQRQIILAVAERDRLGKYLSIFSNAGMEPGIVELDCLSLYNCYEFFNDTKKSTSSILVNVGAYSTNCVAFHPDGNIYFRNLEFGGSTINKTMQENLNLSYLEAEHIKRSTNLSQLIKKFQVQQWYTLRDNLLEAFKRFCSELDQFIKFFQTKTNAEQIDAIYLTGGSTKLQSMLSIMREYLEFPINHWTPLKYLNVNWARNNADVIEKFKYQLPVCLGTALRDDWA